MVDDCAALCFGMDCGCSFSEKCGQAVSNYEVLNRIIDDITDILSLGCDIFSMKIFQPLGVCLRRDFGTKKS